MFEFRLRDINHLLTGDQIVKLESETIWLEIFTRKSMLYFKECYSLELWANSVIVLRSWRVSVSAISSYIQVRLWLILWVDLRWGPWPLPAEPAPPGPLISAINMPTLAHCSGVRLLRLNLNSFPSLYFLVRDALKSIWLSLTCFQHGLYKVSYVQIKIILEATYIVSSAWRCLGLEDPKSSVSCFRVPFFRGWSSICLWISVEY